MIILDKKVPILENLSFSVRRYWYWWLILLATIVMDYLTTVEFVAKYGVKAEANYITRFMMVHLGEDFGNIIGKILQFISVICVVSLSKRFGNFFLLFVVIINCWAIVVNSIG